MNEKMYQNPRQSFEDFFKESAEARQKTSTITEGMLLRHDSNIIMNCNSKNINSNIKNYKEDTMKEDLTFFKDDKDRNENGTKVKNPNRVFAAKKAHKTHGLSYKQAYKRGNSMNKDRASMVVEELEKYLESKIEQSNPVNLYAEINSDNTTMGFQIKFDENNYANVDITAVSQDKGGTGAYQLETGNADKMMASQLFQSLVNDLNTLLSNFDRDFEGVLKKNGIVRRID